MTSFEKDLYDTTIEIFSSNQASFDHVSFRDGFSISETKEWTIREAALRKIAARKLSIYFSRKLIEKL